MNLTHQASKTRLTSKRKSPNHIRPTVRTIKLCLTSSWMITIYCSLIRMTVKVGLVRLKYDFTLLIYFEHNSRSDHLLAFGFSVPLSQSLRIPHFRSQIMSPKGPLITRELTLPWFPWSGGIDWIFQNRLILWYVFPELRIVFLENRVKFREILKIEIGILLILRRWLQ